MAKINVGSRWASELTVYSDPVSKATVRHFTNYKGRSIYCTCPCWYDQGCKIVFYKVLPNRSGV